MEVKIKLNGGIMPTKGSEFAAAYDLYVPEDYIVKPGRQVIDLKFSMELPKWWKANIRARSGNSIKGIPAKMSVFRDENNPYEIDTCIDADVMLGLVDCDYRNNVGVLLKVNDVRVQEQISLFVLSPYTFVIKKGTRIAQMEICRGEETELVAVDELDMSDDRGGGFGHTGA